MIKTQNKSSPGYYRIILKDYLENYWSDWFEGLIISYEGTLTVLTGQLEDQAALHGILNRIRDLNLTLLSVEQVDVDSEDYTTKLRNISNTQ